MTIQAPRIEMPVKEARELYREYRKHQHYSQPIDDEVRRTYQLIAQGRVVIRALEAVRLAGLNDEGLPKLAIMRATEKRCFFRGESDGAARFSDTQYPRAKDRNTITYPRGSFTFPRQVWQAEAMLPTIPLHLRPKRGLANYHVLWEAEWKKIAPVDPMLLRRIGKADLWLVVAAWDLTPVEQAALAGRMNG
jgi:hypothetical protein